MCKPQINLKRTKNSLLRSNRRSGIDVRFSVCFFGSALETKGYCYVPLFGMLLVYVEPHCATRRRQTVKWSKQWAMIKTLIKRRTTVKDKKNKTNARPIRHWQSCSQGGSLDKQYHILFLPFGPKINTMKIWSLIWYIHTYNLRKTKTRTLQGDRDAMSNGKKEKMHDCGVDLRNPVLL